MTYRHRRAWRTTERAKTLAKTGGVCALCGWPGTDGRGKGLQQAHLVPHDQGGRDDHTNLVPLCPSCHRSFDNRRRSHPGQPR